MLMRVVYPGGKYDLVNGDLLTALIDSGGITMFKRADGWVRVPSKDCRNSANRNGYAGSERRGDRYNLDSLNWPVQ